MSNLLIGSNDHMDTLKEGSNTSASDRPVMSSRAPGSHSGSPSTGELVTKRSSGGIRNVLSITRTSTPCPGEIRNPQLDNLAKQIGTIMSYFDQTLKANKIQTRIAKGERIIEEEFEKLKTATDAVTAETDLIQNTFAKRVVEELGSHDARHEAHEEVTSRLHTDLGVTSKQSLERDRRLEAELARTRHQQEVTNIDASARIRALESGIRTLQETLAAAQEQQRQRLDQHAKDQADMMGRMQHLIANQTTPTNTAPAKVPPAVPQQVHMEEVEDDAGSKRFKESPGQPAPWKPPQWQFEGKAPAENQGGPSGARGAPDPGDDGSDDGKGKKGKGPLGPPFGCSPNRGGPPIQCLKRRRMDQPPIFMFEEKLLAENWLLACEDYFRLSGEDWQDKMSRVIFALGRIQGKKVSNFASWYRNCMTGEMGYPPQLEFQHWDNFRAKIISRFSPLAQDRQALRTMKKIEYLGDVQKDITELQDLNIKARVTGVAWREMVERTLPEHALRGVENKEYDRDEDWTQEVIRATMVEERFKINESYNREKPTSILGKRKQSDDTTPRAPKKRKEYTAQEKEAYRAKKNVATGGAKPNASKTIHTNWANAHEGIPQSLVDSRRTNKGCTRCGLLNHNWKECRRQPQVMTIGQKKRNVRSHPYERPKTTTLERRPPPRAAARVHQFQRPQAWDFNDGEAT
ncbi:hypothetical protein HOY82DRAFT_619747 [Tuber indicum]|nr:hypothetical protein HOY82DRAFT_619747 [Tuber indicum]